MTPYRAVAEMVLGDSRIFSGESVKFRCSIPDAHMSTWQYRWFKGSEELHDHGQDLFLWKARIDDTGKFSCQGVRDTVVGEIHTLQSLPVEIFVDGKIDITTNIQFFHSITLSYYTPVSVIKWECGNLNYPNTIS